VGESTNLSGRIESYLQGRGVITEGRVLRGHGYFLDGRLVAAVIDEDLCLFVTRDEGGLPTDQVRPLLVAGIPVPGWVLVPPSSLADDAVFARWIEDAIART
jgi:hypothetical protein